MIDLSLTAVGLVYDGVGIAVLGYAFFKVGVSSLYLNSVTFWGGNRGVLDASVAARADGILGTLLLLFGFVMQFLGANNVQQAFVGEVLLVVLAILLTAYALFIRKLAINFQLRKADEFAARWKAKSGEES